VSWAYVLTEVALHTKWARDRKEDFVRAGMYAAMFQSFGSMIFPALIIHTIVHQSEKHIFKNVKAPSLQRWGPTSLGLGIVPFLPFICDEPVERFWPTSSVAAHDKKKHD